MRFILNFLFFGFLFFLISVYFPDAFQTLVHWAQDAWAFILNAFSTLFSKGDAPVKH